MSPIDKKSNKIAFFGCSLDCDEQYESIQEKCASKKDIKGHKDPYAAVLSLLDEEVQSNSWTRLGSISVPDWLGPFPEVDISELYSEKYVNFIDQDGCREYSDKVEAFVFNSILPAIPCMIGIDHSLTGGVTKAISRYYGQENVSLVVFDSHTDAITMPVMAEAIYYDLETNPKSIYDPNDKLLYNRTDSYNASSFIYHLIREQLIDPNNVYILGVSDFPSQNAFKIKDTRIKNYVNSFVDLKRKGVKLITKEKCIKYPSRIKQLFKEIKTPYIYLSVDMDIGVGNALEGVRFRNWVGLNEKQINKVLMTLLESIRGDQLLGMDFTEFNPRRAGQIFNGTRDATYTIAARLITEIFQKIYNLN